jgi:hypothetical protein
MMVMDDNGSWVPMRASWFSQIASNTGENATPVNISAPVIHGGIDVGSVLGVSKGTWDGKPGPTYTYQWKRDGSNISSATSSSYTVVGADTGAVITCDVKATNSEGNATATSNGIGPIVGIPYNTVAPAITGTATEGEELSASTGTWAANPAVAAYTYQWLRDDEPIAAATANTYTLIEDDVGAVIKAVVTATNSYGATAATSAGTSEVAEGAPVNTVAPAITGTAKDGEELSASTGTWTSTPTPVYTYQWLADDVAIDGATDATYTLTEAEVGAVITVTVTATTALGVGSATSAGTSAVEAA